MEGFQDDNAEFSAEDVEIVAKKAIQSVLNGQIYNNKKVNEWTNAIVTSCLKDLQHLERPFKYVISCIIMQNNGAGMVSSASMFWDGSKDGHCKSTFDNQTINCIVTIFGVSVNIEDQDLENI
jgi:dynein light chain Tctex-type 1